MNVRFLTSYAIFFLSTALSILAQHYPGYDDDDSGPSPPSPTRSGFPNGFAWGCTNISTHLPFCDMSKSVEDRLDDLMFRLSFDEKLTLLGSDNVNTNVDQCTSQDGGVLRLGIPRYTHLVETNSAVAAHCDSDNGEPCASLFPSPSALAASFNRSLWHEKGAIFGKEIRAFGNENRARGASYPYADITPQGYGPNINIVRDPRFGRNSEIPSEDPYLAGSYASVLVNAMQYGIDDRYMQMTASLKHFDAYSVEKDRGSFNANISMYDLWDTYLAQYEMAFGTDYKENPSENGNAFGAMCSYNAINGVPACANDYLLNQVVRKYWKGMEKAGDEKDTVVIGSDCGAIANFIGFTPPIATNFEDAAAAGINGGCDIELGSDKYASTTVGGDGSLEAAIKNNKVSMEVLDNSVRRVLRPRFLLGLFDNNLSDQIYTQYSNSDINNQHSKDIQLEGALQGLVLLKNEEKTLPLKSFDGMKLAVVGPHSISQRDLFESYMGDGACPGGGTDCVTTVGDYFTFLNDHYTGGLTTVVKGVDMDSNDTSDIPNAISAAQEADYVILMLGIGNNQEKEGTDRDNTDLPGLQESFAQQILNVGKPTILVLISGGIITIDKLSGTAPAIIQGFYPGFRTGEALYKQIFGIENRWGRLPVTFYGSSFQDEVSMTVFDMPPNEGNKYPGRTYRYYTGDSVLWEFGHGLSYSEYQIQNCKVYENDNTDSFIITCEVENTSENDGDDVIMIYHQVSKDIQSKVDHPVPLKNLVNFDRIFIQHGNTQLIELSVAKSKLALTTDKGDKALYSGVHYFIVTDGLSSQTLKVTLNIEGGKSIIKQVPQPKA